ncbi:MAG: hypothetical protein KF746_13630 [Chitinophagaceae bacterium]|nr:hypothetical protein [Chitinophagaceae bacterium]
MENPTVFTYPGKLYFWFMSASNIYIDLTKMQAALKQFVRYKAEKAGSNIIYVRNGQLIEENPKTHKKIVLKYVAKHS